MNEEHVVKASHIASLLVKQMQGSLEPGEKQELDIWLIENRCNASLFAELQDKDRLSYALHELNSFNKEFALQKLTKKLSNISRNN